MSYQIKFNSQNTNVKSRIDESLESTTYIYIYIYIYSRINHSFYNQHTYNIYITSVLKIILFTRKTKQKTNTCRKRDY